MHLMIKDYIRIGLILALDHIERRKESTIKVGDKVGDKFRIHKTCMGKVLITTNMNKDMDFEIIYDSKPMKVYYDYLSGWFTVEYIK